MSKPTITIEDIIAYHEAQAAANEQWARWWDDADESVGGPRREETARYIKAAAAHREAAALLRKGLDE